MHTPDLPAKARLVTLAPANPLRERRLALIEQLAYSGPERFNLASVFSTAEGDHRKIDPTDEDVYADTYADKIGNAGSGDLDEVEDKMILDLLEASVTFGTCGRTACLGGHAQIVWYREHQEWISFDSAISRFELPSVACAMHVSPDHPRHKMYEFLMDELGESEEYAEWLVSIMVVRDLIDGRKDASDLPGFAEYDDFTDVEQLQDDGPF